MALAMSRLRVLGKWAVAVLMLGSFTEAVGQYMGPSLLSRGGNSPGRRGRALPKLNVYASGRGLYESGLRLARLDESGLVEPVDAFGTLIEGGVYGGHDWRRVSLGVDYRADYRHIDTPGNNDSLKRLNGTNQVVAVDAYIRPSRRTTIVLSETGGTTNRAFGAFSAPAFGDTSRLGVPLNEVFDARTWFSQAMAGVSHQRTARLAFTGTIGGYFVKREGFALVNSQGYQAIGSVAYRTSRRMSVITAYQYMNFSFPRLLANSGIHGLSGGIQYRLSPAWTLTGTAGGYLIRSTGTEVVRLSPEVAAILGRPTGQAFFRRSRAAPLVDVSATYTQERGSLRLAASSAVVPGNGIYLTSSRQSVSAGYSYAGTRRLSMGVNGGYMRLQSASLSIRNLSSWQGGGGISYRIAAGLNFMSQLDYRSFNSAIAVRGRSGFAASVGLAYNPARFPIAIW
jgi:hypothetical protein